LASNTYFPAITNNNSSFATNFGQRPFSYTPPTGFVALNTYNLPDSTIKKGNTVMDATTYTGNGTGQSVVNAGTFKPDLVWVKSRSTADWHQLVDSRRGVGLTLATNSTAGDQSYPTSITAFNSNGFTVGVDATGGWNINGTTIVGWQWQAGQGSTSSNTSGSITSTVSVNTTAGFSVATFTPPGSGSFTFGHGLGVAPKMVICKNRSSSDNWLSWHGSLGGTQYLLLNTTGAAATNSTIYTASPTSTLINCGSYFSSNAGNYVCYSWAEIAGFSKFGSYTGNGSTDGVFVYTGFRPKYLMVKRTTGSVYAWCVWDSARETYNVENAIITANTSNAENTGTLYVDFLSNGFKFRSFSNGSENASGEPYIYMAFAENPFKNSLAR
jgi:hypothetical protein